MTEQGPIPPATRLDLSRHRCRHHRRDPGGAAVLRVSTVLFVGHPVDRPLVGSGSWGWHPAMVDRYDDTSLTSRELLGAGLAVFPHAIVAISPMGREDLLLVESDEVRRAGHGLTLPVVAKPVCGRGSAGGTVARSRPCASRSPRPSHVDASGPRCYSNPVSPARKVRPP